MIFPIKSITDATHRQYSKRLCIKLLYNSISISLLPCSAYSCDHSLEICRENQQLVLMYKIVHGLAAVPSDKLIPADSRMRSNHSYKFKTISSSTSVYMNSFFPRTIPAWNSLSCNVVDCNTLDSFKAHLSKYLSTALTPVAGYPSLGVCRLPILIQILYYTNLICKLYYLLVQNHMYMVKPKNRPGPAGSYKHCHGWLKRLI